MMKPKPVIPASLLLHYARTTNLNIHIFHSSTYQVLRKIQQEFWVLVEGTAREVLEGYNLFRSIPIHQLYHRSRCQNEDLPGDPDFFCHAVLNYVIIQKYGSMARSHFSRTRKSRIFRQHKGYNCKERHETPQNNMELSIE